MDLLLKGIVGGVMTIIIAYFAKKNPAISGILILFPTFAILSVYFLGSQGDITGLKSCAISSLKTIPSVIGFMGTVYLLSEHLDYKIILVISLLVWLSVAILLQKYL